MLFNSNNYLEAVGINSILGILVVYQLSLCRKLFTLSLDLILYTAMVLYLPPYKNMTPNKNSPTKPLFQTKWKEHYQNGQMWWKVGSTDGLCWMKMLVFSLITRGRSSIDGLFWMKILVFSLTTRGRSSIDGFFLIKILAYFLITLGRTSIDGLFWMKILVFSFTTRGRSSM